MSLMLRVNVYNEYKSRYDHCYDSSLQVFYIKKLCSLIDIDCELSCDFHK